MEAIGDLTYNEEERTVQVITEDGSEELYQDVSAEGFELLSSIEATYKSGTQLLDRLIDVTNKQGLVIQGDPDGEDFSSLQAAAVDIFHDIEQLESEIEGSSSGVVSAQLDTLYKLKKFLQRYFRCLAVGQSLSFSQSLLLQYVRSRNYASLYGFLINVCSTLDYLGRILLNRQGEESVDINSQSTSCVETYNRLSEQGLTESLNPDMEVEILPTQKRMEMGSVGLGGEQMRWLWTRRNEIVHHCPMILEEATAETIPEELLPESVLTQTDVVKLVHLAHRLHYDTLGMFFSYTTDFIQAMVEELVEAVYETNDMGG